jgi:hypothetical protein
MIYERVADKKNILKKHLKKTWKINEKKKVRKQTDPNSNVQME